MYSEPRAVTSWGSLRVDYNFGPDSGMVSPFDVEHNYWDIPTEAGTAPAATVASNTIITSPSQIPAALVADAGLETPYQGLLGWMQAPLPADVDAGETDAPCVPSQSADAGADAGGVSSSGAGSSGGSSGSSAGSSSGGSSGSSGAGPGTGLAPAAQSGCGCKLAAPGSPPASAFVAALALLFARRKRRR
jgi:MYXO-CTERM domain-containing protein